MNDVTVAKIAVSAATYPIDKPYDYKIPQELADKISIGVRVTVPFGRGNRRCEGVVLSLADGGQDKLKSIEAVLDETPVLSPENIKLALWMRDRFFCTVYDAIRTMLPTGLWFKDGNRRVSDKTVSVAVLEIPGEDAAQLAAQRRMRAPQQSAILDLLAQMGSVSLNEIYYFTGAGRPSVKALENLGVITIEKREVFRRPEVNASPGEPIVLNEEQETAFDGLRSLLDADEANAALLCGVTGSGKTSVYIKLIEEAVAKGKTSIVLVPEIALTPQLLSIFTSYFKDKIAVLHSALSMGERYDEWKRIRLGLVRVVVGTRSAIFAPVSDLGLIIIDEEQEHTYKSENSPRYHAREVAKYRCVQSGALLVLGSATPSVESMYNTEEGRYELFRLTNRYNNRELPTVIIADMKKELQAGNGGTISAVLEKELRQNIESGEQSILFINRRGANTLIACGECAYTYMCPRCSVSMTYHSANHRLMCHYCGYSQSVHDECPECGGKLSFIGAGTQKVELELQEMFPGVGIVRMDTDTVSQKNSHEELLFRFQNKKIPILLGTQMVTKGLDFENVTLVGVLSADLSLYINDYRAHERTFSLITQVVGRSGRGEKSGRAVIQTFTPGNEVIRLASHQDYGGFYEREIELRRILGAPPVFDLFVLTASALDETVVLKTCAALRVALEKHLSDVPDIRILGPAPAPVTKINNRFRYRVSISCKNSKRVRDTLSHIIREFSKDKEYRGVSIYADIDPSD